MRIHQEDIDEVIFPRIVVTLFLLQMHELSVEWDFVENLKVIPIPDNEDLTERITEHFDELKELQPGHCDECCAWSIKRIKAYWGPRPMFCIQCWRRRMNTYIRTGEWPSVEWNLDE